MELILCHLILQLVHLLEVEVSITIILRRLSGQERGNEGSFHEQFQGVMSSVRIVQLEQIDA